MFRHALELVAAGDHLAVDRITVVNRQGEGMGSPSDAPRSEGKGSWLASI
jgi:hypothetical protein